MNVPNWQQFFPGLYSAGQPTPVQWQDIRQAGINTVLNLRPDSEQPGVCEASLVKAAGLRYLHLPVASADAIDGASIAAFSEILDANPEGLLIHCGSGNRVGALVALRAHRKGASIADALHAGEAAGLTGLRAKALELMQRSDASAP